MSTFAWQHQIPVPADSVRHILLPPRFRYILLPAETAVRDKKLSVETVRDLFLHTETAVRDKKKLSAETVRVILLPVETLGRKQNHADSFGRKRTPCVLLSS